MSGGLNVPNVNAVTVTANSSGFSIAGGSSSSKTLTVSNSVTVSGTDGSTLNIGAGGTLLSGAFQASSQGTTGAQGVQGTTGSQGAQGTDGVQGNTGAQGTQGLTGPNGIQGATGTQGSTGTQGATGVQGSTGAQGIQGITGSQGATGTQGAVGSTGGTGATGSTGVQGSTGAQGTSGASILGLNNTWTGTNAFASVTATSTTPTTVQLTRSSTSGSQLILGSTYAPTVGTIYSSANVFFTSNAYQTTDSSDAWAKGSGTYSSNSIRLGTSTNNASYAFQIARSPANTANGAIDSFFTQTLLTVLESGNVGIGTASPLAKLQVSSGRSYLFSGDNYSVGLAQTAAQGNYMYLGTASDGTFHISESGGTARFTVQQAGNVGIGTTSPGARLTVSGSASDTVATFTRTGGANCYITMTSGASSDYTYEMATERTGASTGNFYFGGNHSTTFKWRQGGYAQLMNLDTGGLTVTGAITNTNTTTSTSSYTSNSLAFIAGSAASSATYIASSISASHSGASGANLSGSLIGLRVTAAENWGSTTNAFAIQSQLTNTLNFQTITNGYNFHANSPSIVANSYLTNAYGLYIAQQKVTGVTTGYGVYQANSADINHFNGNVGIGTTNPLDKLEINGSDRAIALTVGGGAGNEYGGRWRVYDTGAGVYTSFDTKNVGSWTNNRFTILSSNGNVGIGTTSPSTRLHVSGDSTFNQGSGYVFSITGGSLSGAQQFRHWVGSGTNYYIINDANTGVYLTYGGTSWTANSDERAKDIIEPITNAVNKVSLLRAVIGKYKTDAEGTRRSFLIAQDVQAVLPEAVDASNPENLGVQYSEVIPLLVASIKELTARLAALENK
jgi:hypothetical protein